MDAKRTQSLRKVATPVASKSKMSKTQSQASVTPSQLNEQNRTNNGDKNPLDALSRSAMPPIIERRSGLQDIDEEYYKKINFLIQNPQRYDHAAGQRTVTPGKQPDTNAQQTGGAAQQIHPVTQQINVTQEQMLAQPTQVQQSMSNSFQQQQQQQQQEITQQQINYSPASGEPEMCTTCPHCQTIIYLARSNVEMPMTNIASGGVHGQPDGTGVGTEKL